jgi:hypothetical protein
LKSYTNGLTRLKDTTASCAINSAT